jgi:acyl-CoA thioesterase
MDQAVKEAIYRAVEREPFAVAMGMTLKNLDDGYSLVEMRYHPERMANMYQRAHGGAVFALIDEAFEAAGQTGGSIAVALNVNVTYVASPHDGRLLTSEARQVSRTRKTAGYDIRVTEEGGRIIATCQALAYLTGKPIPFL